MQRLPIRNVNMAVGPSVRRRPADDDGDGLVICLIRGVRVAGPVGLKNIPRLDPGGFPMDD